MISRIIYEKKKNVGFVTINRPEVHNALDLAAHAELCEIWNDFENDENLQVAVLTGAGDNSFSVGQDLKELVGRIKRGEKPATFGSGGGAGAPRLTERFNICKPIIARVNGYAIGGGFELALACDIIVASENAVFALPEAKLGLIPGAGGVFRLVRQLPYKVAMGYLLTGRRIEANKAFDLGLVNQVVSHDQLDFCVAEWIGDILKCSPRSIRSIKEASQRSLDISLSEAFREKYYWEEQRIEGDECIEGPLAFVEKRAPKWAEDK